MMGWKIEGMEFVILEKIWIVVRHADNQQSFFFQAGNGAFQETFHVRHMLQNLEGAYNIIFVAIVSGVLLYCLIIHLQFFTL